MREPWTRDRWSGLPASQPESFSSGTELGPAAWGDRGGSVRAEGGPRPGEPGEASEQQERGAPGGQKLWQSPGSWGEARAPQGDGGTRRGGQAAALFGDDPESISGELGPFPGRPEALHSLRGHLRGEPGQRFRGQGSLDCLTNDSRQSNMRTQAAGDLQAGQTDSDLPTPDRWPSSSGPLPRSQGPGTSLSGPEANGP